MHRSLFCLFFTISLCTARIVSGADSRCDGHLQSTYLLGPELRPYHRPHCQKGFGLCWLATSLSFLEVTLQRQGTNLHLSFDHLMSQYFKSRALEALDHADDSKVSFLSSTGNFVPYGFSLIRSFGLVPETEWTPGKLQQELHKKPNTAVLLADSFIAQLKVLVLLWLEEIQKNPDNRQKAVAGIEAFIAEQLGSSANSFTVQGELHTPHTLVKIPQIDSIFETLKIDHDPTKPLHDFNRKVFFKLASPEWLQNHLETQLLTLSYPIIVSMSWNALSLGSNPEIMKSLFDGHPITGSPEIFHKAAPPQRTQSMLQVLDETTFNRLPPTTEFPSHALLLVDGILNQQKELTHVVLLNSHGLNSGYGGYHIVPLAVFQHYRPSLWLPNL